MIDDRIKITLAELRDDNQSGASQLVEKAINILLSQLDVLSDSDDRISSILKQLAMNLMNSRPSMAPIMNMMGYLFSNVKEASKNDWLRVLHEFGNYREVQKESLIRAFDTFIQDNCQRTTCFMLNSYSSTILELFKHYTNWDFEFLILESRPLFEGQGTAKMLSKHFSTKLIIDAAMGKYMNQVDHVLIGTDSVLRDGSVINKIGTYPLACIAKAHNKEVHVVGDKFKYNLRSHFNQNVTIDKKPPIEVYNALEDDVFGVENYYFDITPPEYL
jgi:translation initiation factor 2B subunit (eIF-2B alpha/beta/delta family)